jgi:hypothetical protein
MIKRSCFCLGLALCALLATTAMPVTADAESRSGRSHRYTKLDASERVRAIERARAAAVPELSRRAARAQGLSFRSEVLLVEHHRFDKGEDASRRLADVYIYDYEQDRLCRAVVDLDSDNIESLDVAQSVQLPLTASEVARSLKLVLDHPEFGDQLRSDYLRITGNPLASPDDLAVGGFTYRADSMNDNQDRESRVCGKRRCAQLLLRTPDGIVLDLPIIDLSRGALLDSREFGMNGIERMRRRRAAAAERAKRAGASDSSHGEHGNGQQPHQPEQQGGGHAH